MAIAVMVLIASGAAAQEATEQPTQLAPVPILVEQAQQAAQQAAESAQEARAHAEDAGRYAGDASNFLGIFEAISLAITVVVGGLGVFGVTRLFQAQSELTRTAKDVKEDLAKATEGFAAQLEEKQRELDALKEELKRSAKEERARSDQASLGLSLLPLAERQYKVKDFDGALATYHRALELDPQNIVIYYRLGYVYTQYGKFDDALYYLKEALKIDENFAPALATLGYVLRRKAEKLTVQDIKRGELLAEAEQLMRRALDMSPKLVDEDGESWWGSLGGLHRRRGQIDDAIEVYKRAHEVTPLASYPLGNLALLYLQKRDHQQMLDTYERVERLAMRRTLADPTDFWGHADVLVARVALKRGEAAEEALIALFAATPVDRPEMLNSPLDTLRQLCAELGSVDGAPIQVVIDKMQTYIDQRIAARAAKPEMT
jgi:tetratricopeptide (TPR) repeat protein